MASATMKKMKDFVALVGSSGITLCKAIEKLVLIHFVTPMLL